MRLNASIFGSELPINARLDFVALSFIHLDLSFEPLFIRYSPIQTLATQHTQLDLRHVQPTPMLGRVMKFQLLQDSPRLGCLESLIQGGWLVRVEIVHHDTEYFRF